MTTQEQLLQLQQRLVDQYNDLLKQVMTLQPDDQKIYAEKVSRLIDRTKEIVNKKAELQPR